MRAILNILELTEIPRQTIRMIVMKGLVPRPLCYLKTAAINVSPRIYAGRPAESSVPGRFNTPRGLLSFDITGHYYTKI